MAYNSKYTGSEVEHILDNAVAIDAEVVSSIAEMVDTTKYYALDGEIYRFDNGASGARGVGTPLFTNLYDKSGVEINMRFNTAATAAYDGAMITNWMNIPMNSSIKNPILRIKGLPHPDTFGTHDLDRCVFKKDGEDYRNASGGWDPLYMKGLLDGGSYTKEILNDGTLVLTLLSGGLPERWGASTSAVWTPRICFDQFNGSRDPMTAVPDLIITLNEEIKYGPSGSWKNTHIKYNESSTKIVVDGIADNVAYLEQKVDKQTGKQLSTEDFTTALKTKLEGLSNYNDAQINAAVSSLQTQLNTLVSGNANDAINSFNEIIAFLDGIKDSQDLSSIIASIEQQIAAKMDKVTLAKVATSGSYNDLSNKPTIPSAVTESTVSGWGFTKNTGTYSKPSGGIPKTDLASAVQTSLGKADTALQSYTEQYKGTVTGVKINGSTKNPSSGVVDLGTVITSHQDISGKLDKTEAASTYAKKTEVISLEVTTVSSVEEMVDTSKIYVLDGEIYKYAEINGEPIPMFTNLYDKNSPDTQINTVLTSAATAEFDGCFLTNYMDIPMNPSIKNPVLRIKGLPQPSQFGTHGYYRVVLKRNGEEFRSGGNWVFYYIESQLNSGGCTKEVLADGTVVLTMISGGLPWVFGDGDSDVNQPRINFYNFFGTGAKMTEKPDLIITLNEEIKYRQPSAWVNTHIKYGENTSSIIFNSIFSNVAKIAILKEMIAELQKTRTIIEE